MRKERFVHFTKLLNIPGILCNSAIKLWCGARVDRSRREGNIAISPTKSSRSGAAHVRDHGRAGPSSILFGLIRACD